MKRRIFSILFALVLVLSFSLIPTTVSATDPPEIDGVISACIYGEVYEVNCERLPGATVGLYLKGELLYKTVSNPEGEYILLAEGVGEFEVVVSKEGYKTEKQTVEVDETGMFELNFCADSGLVPTDVDMSYLLKCINLWLYAEEHGECGLTMSSYLSVVNSWLYPT